MLDGQLVVFPLQGEFSGDEVLDHAEASLSGCYRDRRGEVRGLNVVADFAIRLELALSVAGDPDPTLFAHGLRNPWRLWIDESLMYIADVGQDAYEEVSVAPLAPGQNFGWPITEGLHCFRPPSGCDSSGQILPVLEVAAGDSGTCSITGGVVYRGLDIPELFGSYLYSDYCGGYLRSFRFNAMGEALTEEDWTAQVGVAGQVTGFGVDGSGEVYVTTTASLLKLVAIR